jgi:hypothetical protein
MGIGSKTYNEVTVQFTLRTRRCRNGLQVVNVVVKHDFDSTGSDVFLNLLAILVGVGRIEKLRVRVNNGDLFAREGVLDLASVF